MSPMNCCLTYNDSCLVLVDFGSFKQWVTGLLQKALFCLFLLSKPNVSDVLKLLFEEGCLLRCIFAVFVIPWITILSSGVAHHHPVECQDKILKKKKSKSVLSQVICLSSQHNQFLKPFLSWSLVLPFLQRFPTTAFSEISACLSREMGPPQRFV